MIFNSPSGPTFRGFSSALSPPLFETKGCPPTAKQLGLGGVRDERAEKLLRRPGSRRSGAKLDLNSCLGQIQLWNFGIFFQLD